MWSKDFMVVIMQENMDITFYRIWQRGSLSDFEWEGTKDVFESEEEALKCAETQLKKYCGADFRVVKEHYTREFVKDFINNSFLEQ